MKKITFILLLFVTVQAIAQQQADWKTSVEGNAKSIFFHYFTQTPIVETSTHYYGMDPQNEKILWSIKKPSLQAVAVQTAQNMAGLSDEVPDYLPIPHTQFAVINNNLIDISNGTLLLGEEKEPFKILLSNDIVPELNLLLFQVRSKDNSERLYAIDLATDNIVWDIVLMAPNAGKDILKFVSKMNGLDRLTVNQFAPCATKEGNIIYNNNGKLVLLNGQTGETLWENACNPATFFMNEDQSQLLVIEKRSGFSNATSLRGPKPYGKKVIAINPVTGKNTWTEPIKLDGMYKTFQFADNNNIIVASEDGINLYETITGKKLWKKDFKADNLKLIKKIAKGMEIQYGNKIMAIDQNTGKKAWKKPIQIKGIDEKSKADFYEKTYKDSRAIMTDETLVVYTNAGKEVAFSINETSRIAFDDANEKILIIHGKRIYLIDPNNLPKKIKPTSIKLDDPRNITGYKISDNGYFIFGNKEYAFLDKSGKVIEQKNYPQLKIDRLGKALLLTATIATSVYGMNGTISVDGGPKEEFGVFTDPATAKALQEISESTASIYRTMRANEKLRHAVRSDKDYAYFMQGIKNNDTERIDLVVVDQNNGKEVKNIDFSHDRRVIYEIDSNNNMLYYLDNGNFNIIKL